MANKNSIRASSNGKRSNNIIINRPTWSGMVKHYPIEPSPQFYSKISRSWEKLATSSDEIIHQNWANTCAVRMSYALNRNGIQLGKGKVVVIPDNPKDKYQYWIKVKDLTAFLKFKFKEGNIQEEIGVLKDINAGTLQQRKIYVQQRVLDEIKGKKRNYCF